jgi:hypothetical protein
MNSGQIAAFNNCHIVRYSVWRSHDSETEPNINFTDSRFRRRLSMISRMTARVVHDIMPFDDNTKLYFISFRGELNQQFKINKMLIKEGAVLPAAFSLSVFNTAPAFTAMALNLTAGYSAVYPGKNDFSAALLGAAAALNTVPAAKQIVLVYADEEPVIEYKSLEKDAKSLAFAALLSAGDNGGDGVPLAGISSENYENPERFLAAMESANIKRGQQY